MSLRLFISRSINDDSPFLDLECDIYAESFIQIHLSNKVPDLTGFDWLFFSSSNGVKWAIENKIDLNAFKIGAIGPATENRLNDFDIQVDFTGEATKTIEEVSQDFSNSIPSGSRVLFPISSRSKKTILRNFKHTYEVFEAYQTEYDFFILEEEMDIYVFTSPSNFNSFYQANGIKPNKLVVAMGETTKSEIEKYLNIPIFTPKEKTEASIYETLCDLIPTYFSN